MNKIYLSLTEFYAIVSLQAAYVAYLVKTEGTIGCCLRNAGRDNHLLPENFSEHLWIDYEDFLPLDKRNYT